MFDADNLLDENYIAGDEQNLHQGYRVITSYGKIPRTTTRIGLLQVMHSGSLHEAEYFNLPRMVLNTSCAISGTGFLVHC